MNQQVKNLIQKLGEAIHESVSESEQIADVVREIREQGFDVLLMLEATIGLNQVDENEDAAGPVDETVEGPFTRNDLNFLRSLRITTEEDTGESTDMGDQMGDRAGDPPLGLPQGNTPPALGAGEE